MKGRNAMNHPNPSTSGGAPPLSIEEDGGLATLLGGPTDTLGREAVLREAAILQAARDELQHAFSTDERRRLLNPFAPAGERNTEVITVLRRAIGQHRTRGGPLARVPTDDETLLAIFAATIGWGPAQRYLDDPRVNEVKIIGRRIRVQESGKPFLTVAEQFASAAEVRDRAMLLASLMGVHLDAQNPQETLPADHGTRIHATIPPRIPTDDGALICIRRGRRVAWDVHDLMQRGAFNQQIADLLLLLARARCSFLIAGRTGSGKTALLEALANSWPGDPHILTIEDHMQEIHIRRADLWTREQVNTQRDPDAFGRVAREALRQTPDLLCPGEIRGNEAGAVLALVLSDHPVITTLHARSCSEAIERFASFAAMPGAYMYEGRRGDALRDAASGFDVVIKLDNWEELGLRLITDIALLDGAVVDQGVLRPALVPLARVDVLPDGRIDWHCQATVGAGGLLEWDEGDPTPESLREKLVRARALAQVRQTATSLDTVADAISRAQTHTLAGEPERALATLRNAWLQRRDPRLIGAAQDALNQAPGMFASLIQQADAESAALQRLMASNRWRDARLAFDAIMTDLALAAHAAPPGGWEAVEALIRQGIAAELAAEEARIEAERALDQGQARLAVDMLARFTPSDLPLSIALPLIRVREQAMEQLVKAGQGSAAALATVRAQRRALETSSEHHVSATTSA
ncbi:MAG: Flp pilus assembly complex ATPase component TadA [Roseiflexus sp.]|nr:Flp pilus assembly complex ATPase component TadA [Roseiflexus sp.]MBO9381750.1 Flp pilus assembly complex ATPase component TadA [Roseiflexus sp.]MBO9388568.1 Flp pilus assembly complex ATPase component TadA [Roseiflexus sp.]